MKRLKNEDGAALVLALILITVFGIFSVSVLSFILKDSNMSLSHQRKTAAYYIARSGAVSVGKAIEEMDTEDSDKTDELDELVSKLKSSPDGIKAEVPEVGEIERLTNKDTSLDVSVHLEDESTIRVDSVGVFKKESRKVSQYIETKKVKEASSSSGNITSIDADTAIYADGDLNIEKNPNVYGGIVMRSKANVTVEKEKNLEANKKINILEEARNYPNIDIEKLDSLAIKIPNKDSTSTSVTSISESTVFTNNSVTFKIPNTKVENKTIDIVVNNLDLSGNNILDIEGSGKVRLHVKNSLSLSDVNHINKGGNPNQLEIYYYGEDNLLLLNKPDIGANIFVEKANVVINKNPKIGIIYAPKSNITLNQNGSISKIIGKNIVLEGNPNINKSLTAFNLPIELMTYDTYEGATDDGTFETKVKGTYLK